MFRSVEKLVSHPILALRSALESQPESSVGNADHETEVRIPKYRNASRDSFLTPHLGATDDLQFNDHDREIIGRVEKALEEGLQLKRWWEQVNAANAYRERFELVRKFNSPDESFGFFDDAPIGQGTTPVMGELEDRLFDQPKSTDARAFQDELREFVLQYFLRISDFRRPEAYVPTAPNKRAPGWNALNWCPKQEKATRGFGYSQAYYKRRADGRVGKFSPEEQSRIIDLRRIHDEYEWVVFKVDIFDFRFELELLGNDSPQLSVPLRESSYLVINRDFIEDDQTPAVDRHGQRVQGRFGFGYAFVRNPQQELLGYGPGEFDVAFQLVNFRVMESGEIRACLVFVANRPRQVVNLPIAPVDWSFRIADAFTRGAATSIFGQVRRVLDRPPLRWGGFDPVLTYTRLLNLSTGGVASKQYCVSKETLEKIFLVRHFMQHYDMMNGSLQTWRQVRDWLDADQLPESARTGITA